MTLVQMIIVAICIAAAIGILLIFLKVAGIEMPSWLMQVVWIVVAAVVCILAIRFIVSLM